MNGVNPDTGALSCSTPDVIVVNGGGGADLLDIVSPPGPSQFPGVGTMTINGGDGADELRGSWIGSSGFVGTLLGGAGNDLLIKSAFGVVRGGPGDDRLVGAGAAGQTFDGEDGSDEVYLDISTGSQVQFTLIAEDSGLSAQVGGGPSNFLPWTSIERVDALLNDGDQTVDAGGFSGTLRVNGLGGADTLIGGPGPDHLSGGAGNDVLEGSGGPDQLLGDSGDDLLRARDGVADGGDCGPGGDTLIADTADALLGCEIIDVPPPLPAPPPATPSLGRATVGVGWRVRGSRTTITRLRIGKRGAKDGGRGPLRRQGLSLQAHANRQGAQGGDQRARAVQPERAESPGGRTNHRGPHHRPRLHREGRALQAPSGQAAHARHALPARRQDQAAAQLLSGASPGRYPAGRLVRSSAGAADSSRWRRRNAISSATTASKGAPS